MTRLAATIDSPPPSDTGLERSLLGCVLVKPSLLADVAALVVAADFYSPAHGIVFRAMLAMQADHVPIDAETLGRALAARGELTTAGGLGYIGEIIGSCPTWQHWKFYCGEIVEKSQLRQLKYHATELLEDLAKGTPAKELLASAANRIADLRKELGLAKPPEITSLASAAQKRAGAIGTKHGLLRKLGFPELDYAIGGGVADGEMVIFGARPSHCKSLVALQSIHAQTARGDTCVIVSEEMTSDVLGERTLLFASEIPREEWDSSKTIVVGDAATYRNEHAPCIVVTDTVTTSRAVDEITKAVEVHGARFAAVDYAQLLESPGRTMYEQVTATSKAIKRAAVKLKIPILLLCQLNREVEKAKTFVPTMKDLRDSGQLEQDADVVLFGVWPHRINHENSPTDYQFFVAKNRNRAIRKAAFGAKINPSRQYIDAERPGNYESTFDKFKD